MLSIFNTVVGAINSFVEALNVIGIAVEGLKVIGNLLLNFAKTLLDLIKPETTVEDLGDKALQSGYNLEDYDSFADYVKAVDNFELDPEKSKLTTEKEKLEKGSALGLGLLSEKNPQLDFESFFEGIVKNPEYFKDGQKLSSLLELAKKDESSFRDVTAFLSGKDISSQGLNNATTVFKTIEKNINPSIDIASLNKTVLDLRK